MTDATYATQTPLHDPRGPRIVDCCVKCAPAVIDLRDQIDTYKGLLAKQAATMAALRDQVESLGQRAAENRNEAFELRVRLGDKADDIPTAEQRLAPWRREWLKARGVEIGERVKV